MKLESLKKVEEVVEQQAVNSAPVVDITNNPNGGRVLTIQLPNFKHISDEERAQIEEQKGKEAIAMCDATGALIFNSKNVNEIHNDEREEFAGLTFSTAFLKELVSALKKSAENS